MSPTYRSTYLRSILIKFSYMPKSSYLFHSGLPPRTLYELLISQVCRIPHLSHHEKLLNQFYPQALLELTCLCQHWDSGFIKACIPNLSRCIEVQDCITVWVSGLTVSTASDLWVQLLLVSGLLTVAECIVIDRKYNTEHSY